MTVAIMLWRFGCGELVVAVMMWQLCCGDSAVAIWFSRGCPGHVPDMSSGWLKVLIFRRTYHIGEHQVRLVPCVQCPALVLGVESRYKLSQLNESHKLSDIRE